jgi:hypothetical protein
MNHTLRHFASRDLIAEGGSVSIAVCELCGTVYIVQPGGLEIVPQGLRFDDDEPVTEETVIGLFIGGDWDELDAPLCDGGVVIRQYRSLT